jgi:peptidoglycan/LPS O-acetylase OafA/YrhL
MMSLARMRLQGWRLSASFYLRRLFRIYPLSTVVILVTLIAHIPPASWNSQYHSPTLPTVISNLLLSQNLLAQPSLQGPFWSLPLEVQMYLVLPVLFVIVRRISSFAALLGIWVGAVGIGLVQSKLATVSGFGIERLDVAAFAPCFLAGVVAFYMSQRTTVKTLRSWLWPGLLGIVTTLYLLLPAVLGETSVWHQLGEWVCCLLLGLLVSVFAEPKNASYNWLTHHVAKYSYGLYVFQIPVLWFVFVKLAYLPQAVAWPLFAVLMVLVPVVSYHLVENPCILLGARLSKSAFETKVATPVVASPVR